MPLTSDISKKVMFLKISPGKVTSRDLTGKLHVSIVHSPKTSNAMAEDPMLRSKQFETENKNTQ